VFAVGALILKHIASGEPWNSRDRLSIFALLTLGNYIKGPIVYVFILPGLLVYEWLRRNRGGGAAWCGWWPWISSLALFIVWVVGGIVTQPGFFDQVVTHEFLGRFSSAEQAPHPPYFYIGHLLQKFAPWLELMLVLAIVTVRKSAVPIRRMLAEISPSTLWLCCWVGGGLIVMSLVPSKRIDRIYPMVAPMCLLLAAQIARANGRAFRWSMLAFVLSIFIALHYVGYKRVYLGYHCQRDALSQFGKSVRDEAAIRHLRYDAIVSHDGALLLYLAKTQFIEIESAIAKWNAGELDAIVGETDKFPALLESCRNSKIGELRATEQSDERARTYGVIVRQ
jgi:4-amino-4-deoxy-L-arabinose transferase-like glycosyltransferase